MVPDTHEGQLTATCNSSSRGSDVLSFVGTKHTPMCCTYTLAGETSSSNPHSSSPTVGAPGYSACHPTALFIPTDQGASGPPEPLAPYFRGVTCPGSARRASCCLNFFTLGLSVLGLIQKLGQTYFLAPKRILTLWGRLRFELKTVLMLITAGIIYPASTMCSTLLL